MSSPLVSVIIPCFNNEQYIEQCLRSVSEQSYSNIEIIVVDDKSSDCSVRIIKQLINQNHRIKLYINSVNKGVSYTRNSAIKYSNGEYITTLDSDDYYFSSNKIQSEMDVILNGGIKALPFSDVVIVNEKGGVNKILTFDSQLVFTKRDCLLRSVEIPRDFIFPRTALSADEECFDSKILIFEDWDFKLRLLNSYNFVYSGENGVAYRQHSTGLSSKNKMTVLYWLFYVYIKNSRNINFIQRLFGAAVLLLNIFLKKKNG